jgi:hypothetical protein
LVRYDPRHGLGSWSVDDIATYLKTGHNKTTNSEWKPHQIVHNEGIARPAGQIEQLVHLQHRDGRRKAHEERGPQACRFSLLAAIIADDGASEQRGQRRISKSVHVTVKGITASGAAIFYL